MEQNKQTSLLKLAAACMVVGIAGASSAEAATSYTWTAAADGVWRLPSPTANNQWMPGGTGGSSTTYPGSVTGDSATINTPYVVSMDSTAGVGQSIGNSLVNLSISGGGTLRFVTGNATLASGTTTIAAGSTVLFNSGSTSQSFMGNLANDTTGTSILSNSGTMHFSASGSATVASVVNFKTATNNVGGKILINVNTATGNTRAGFYNDLTNDGLIQLGLANANAYNATLEIGSHSALTGPARVVQNSMAKLINNNRVEILENTAAGGFKVKTISALLDNRTGGVFQVQAQNSNVVLGMGLAALDGTSHVNSGSVQLDTGSQLKLAAYNKFTNNSGGVIQGLGTFDASAAGAEFVNNGTIAPGSVGTIGKLSFKGTSFTNGAGALLKMDIAGAASYDELAVGSIDLTNSTLDLSLVGYTPTAGDQFVLLSGTSLNGTFSSVTVGGAANPAFDVSYAGNKVTLIVVPEPAAIALGGLSLLGLLARRNRKA